MNLVRILFVSIIIVLWAAAVFAIPEIAVVQPIFDFGSIGQGKKVVHVFTIKNKGDLPLAIKKITPSCGCTAVSSSASVILPGKSGEIKATFDSTNFAGPVHKTITVKTNDPKVSFVTLTIQGTVITEIQITPMELNLGAIRGNETKKVLLSVVNNGNKPLDLTAVKTPVAHIVAVADKKQLLPGQSATIHVTITPHSGDRMVSGFVSIPTGNPAKPETLVPVYGSVVY
jgi:hypothetical protein